MQTTNTGVHPFLPTAQRWNRARFDRHEIRSNHTLRAANWHLRTIADLIGPDTDTASITRADLEVALELLHISPRSANQVRSTLRQFFGWATDVADICERNPAAGIRNARTDRRTPRRVPRPARHRRPRTRRPPGPDHGPHRRAPRPPPLRTRRPPSRGLRPRRPDPARPGRARQGPQGPGRTGRRRGPAGPARLAPVAGQATAGRRRAPHLRAHVALPRSPLPASTTGASTGSSPRPPTGPGTTTRPTGTGTPPPPRW